jgi:hypothetical protein
MKCCKKTMITIVFAMIFVIVISSTNTFAYWGEESNEENSTASVQLGSWFDVPSGVDAYVSGNTYSTGDLVWYENQLWIFKNNSTTQSPSITNGWTTLYDFNWYSTIIYQQDDIVFYNDTVYKAAYYNTNQNPESSNAWINTNTNDVEWKTGQASNMNKVVYYNNQLYIHKNYYSTTEPGTAFWSVLGDFTWKSGNTYLANDLVLYNGIYYVAGWDTTGNIPGTHNSWTVATIPTWATNIPNSTKFVTHNGNIYRALVNLNGNNKRNEPGTAAGKGIWQMLGTQQWQQYNTYALNDLVMHNGYVYQLTNVTNSIIEPGTAANSWNLKNTIDYQPFNYYANGDYAIYNGEVYVVVNQTNANYNVAPGSVANAWNNISGYIWNNYNTYSLNSIVLYNSTIYRAISVNTNIIPGSPGSETSWEINNA